jgi:hypothetical protein
MVNNQPEASGSKPRPQPVEEYPYDLAKALNDDDDEAEFQPAGKVE